LFAVFAITLGAMFANGAVAYYERSLSEPTTRDQHVFRENSVRLTACSALLILAGVWYGRIGLLGERPHGR
jgi:hypothetical protein